MSDLHDEAVADPGGNFRETVASLAGKDVRAFNLVVFFRDPSDKTRTRPDGTTEGVIMQAGGGCVTTGLLPDMIRLMWKQVARMEATLLEVCGQEVSEFEATQR